MLAGPVGPYHRPADLAAAGDEARQNPDVRFFHDEVAPHVDGDRVRWVGTVAGQERDDLLATRPGVAVPAALGGAGRHGGGRVARPGHAGGGHARGCLPELIEHGRTGLLTDDEDAWPTTCPGRRAGPGRVPAGGGGRFTPAVMAARYESLYRRVLQLAG